MDESSVGPRTNIVLSIGILVACGLGWLATNTLPAGLRVDPLGPAYYPRFVLLGTAALAFALLVASIRDLRRQPEYSERAPAEPVPIQTVGAEAGSPELAAGTVRPVAETEEEEEAFPPISYPRMLSVLGLSFAYVLLMERVGYFISTVVYVVALLLLLRVRNPLAIAACAIGIPLVLDSLFSRLLGIPLPGGILDQFADLLP